MEDPKYSELDHDERQEKQDYITRRWSQLANASRDARKEISKFIALINAGGAVAVLAFMGALFQGSKESAIGNSGLLRAALICFIAGVIACAAAGAIEDARLGGLFAKWRQRVNSFYGDTLGFKAMLDQDTKQAADTGYVGPLFIYLALGCFVVGCLCGGFLLTEEIK